MITDTVTKLIAQLNFFGIYCNSLSYEDQKSRLGPQRKDLLIPMTLKTDNGGIAKNETMDLVSGTNTTQI